MIKYDKSCVEKKTVMKMIGVSHILLDKNLTEILCWNVPHKLKASPAETSSNGLRLAAHGRLLKMMIYIYIWYMGSQFTGHVKTSMYPSATQHRELWEKMASD